MPEANFDMLRDELLRQGVAPRHVIRMMTELADHQEDLELEATQQGFDAADASRHAAKRIGSGKILAAHVLCRPELKSWVYRYPRLSRLILPVAYLALLPLAPVFAGIAIAPVIVRWSACLILSAVITALMLLVMQISIAMT
jgi:hypothetical protein